MKRMAAERQETNEEAKAALNVLRDAYLPHYRAQVLARAQSATLTTRPFSERLVHFWANHFAVSADKGAIFGLAGTLENEAIRPHVPWTCAASSKPYSRITSALMPGP